MFQPSKVRASLLLQELPVTGIINSHGERKKEENRQRHCAGCERWTERKHWVCKQWPGVRNFCHVALGSIFAVDTNTSQQCAPRQWFPHCQVTKQPKDPWLPICIQKNLVWVSNPPGDISGPYECCNRIWKIYYSIFIHICTKIANQTQDALAIHHSLV